MPNNFFKTDAAEEPEHCNRNERTETAKPDPKNKFSLNVSVTDVLVMEGLKVTLARRNWHPNPEAKFCIKPFTANAYNRGWQTRSV